MFVMEVVLLKKIVTLAQKCPSIACPYCVHFLMFFSYNINKLSYKSMKICTNVEFDL